MNVLLIVYDNATFLHAFPSGLAYIAAVLEQEGHSVSIYNQDVHHYPESHLTKYLDNNEFEVVGVSVVAGYYQFAKLLKISEAINRSKRRDKMWYIIGGHGPSPEPEYFLQKTKADIAVLGEGEATIAELIDAICKDTLQRVSTVPRASKELRVSAPRVPGIAWRDENGNVIINKPRPLIKDIDSIPFPAYHLFPIQYYRLWTMPNKSRTDFVMSVFSGRGCTFKCNFCYRMDKGFRPRSDENIIEEIKLLKKDYRINCIKFDDDLLMNSRQRVISFCNSVIKAKLNIKWYCNGRLNFATPQVLKLMKKAGCVFINYGIEAMDDKVLKNMNKSLTTRTITRGIEATLAEGISPGLNIIWGNIGDTKETLQKGVDFLLKYDDGTQLRTIRPVTPYPGSPLYYHAIKKGLLKDVADFYENKHTNSDLLTVNFTNMSDGEFYTNLYEANAALLRNYYQKASSKAVATAYKLYFEKDTAFRGFRTV